MSDDDTRRRPEIAPEAANGGDDDLRALGKLPAADPPAAQRRRIHHAARAAFLEASSPDPGSVLVRFAMTATRTTMPVVLASVVGLYLLWAFQIAIAINRP
jgi:hypothetical protein